MTNCNERVTVWWIDDDHADATGPRESERAALEEQAGQDLNLVAIHPADFERHVSNLSKESGPDLLLIDFRLGTQALPGKPTPYFARDGVTLRGTTLGDRRLKDAPAYLVSRVTRKEQVGSSDDHFDWVLSHQQLIRGFGSTLLADASDYRLLRETNAAACRSSDCEEIQQALVKALCNLLRVPEASLESVEELAGHTIGSLLRNESNLDSGEIKLAPSRPRAIAQWVRSALQRFRGPLLDELSVANMLGTRLEYFRTTLVPMLDLDSATYTGIFSRTTSMTLWRQQLLHLLSQIPTTRLSSPAALAQSAAEHFGVPDPEQAICRVCQKPWPEAIAFDEDDPSVEATVHWRCSKEAIDVDSVFGFDIQRSFNE